MATKPRPVPEGFHTLTPHVIVRGAAQAIEFYKRAFGAEEISRVTGPDGASIMHAALKIGDTMLQLCDEFPHMGCLSPQSLGGSGVILHLYVADVDALFQRAAAAGAAVQMPPADMFWGDRYGRLCDPFGHVWSMATRQRDVTPEQVRQAAATAYAPKPVTCA